MGKTDQPNFDRKDFKCFFEGKDLKHHINGREHILSNTVMKIMMTSILEIKLAQEQVHRE